MLPVQPQAGHHRRGSRLPPRRHAGPAAEVLSAEPVEDIAFDVLSRQDVHLVLSKSYPDAAQVMQRLEAIAAKLDVEALLARDEANSGKGLAPGKRATASPHISRSLHDLHGAINP